MNQPKRIKVTDVNPFLICVLCGGYYIDATTIIECLHSFCRSCIVKYLEKNKYCPICDVQVHKSTPLLNIRNDKTLQTIVYKLVPSLFLNEMTRRREFYKSVDLLKRPSDAEARGEVGLHSSIILPDETISICLEYTKTTNNNNTQIYGKRYLHCPGGVTVAHLHRILRGKFSLTRRHSVQIYFKDDHLPETLSLIDLAYTYQWRRKGPIHLNYRILEMRRKWLRRKEDDGKETLTLTLPAVVTGAGERGQHQDKEWKEVSVAINENGVLSVKGIESIRSAVSNLVRNSELEVVPLDPDVENKSKTLEANKLSISRMTQPKGEALNRIVSKLSPNERLIGNTSVSIRAVPCTTPAQLIPIHQQQAAPGSPLPVQTSVRSTPPPAPPRPSPVLSSVSLLKQVPTQNSVVVGNVTVSKEAPSKCTREDKDSVPRVSVSLTKEPPLLKPKMNKFKYKALHWNPSIDRSAMSTLKQADTKRTNKIFKSRNVPYLRESVEADQLKASQLYQGSYVLSRCRPPPYAPGSPKRPPIGPSYVSRLPSPAHSPSFIPSYPSSLSLFPRFLPDRFPPPDLLRSIFHRPLLPPPVQHVPPSPKPPPLALPPPPSIPPSTSSAPPPLIPTLPTPTPPTTNINNNNIAKEFPLKPPTNPIST